MTLRRFRKLLALCKQFPLEAFWPSGTAHQGDHKAVEIISFTRKKAGERRQENGKWLKVKEAGRGLKVKKAEKSKLRSYEDGKMGRGGELNPKLAIRMCHCKTPFVFPGGTSSSFLLFKERPRAVPIAI
ncbi:MAG: hypothetical protein NTX75_15835 [Proteobacteria bacterium]|nr:hypothetical protein [Pseudomonadota bacterium]